MEGYLSNGACADGLTKQKWALLVLALIYFLTPLHGQPNVIQTGFYGLNDGLSDRLITDVLQSSNGYMWIGTPSGLNLFDGYEFTIFNDHPNNPNQISNANVERIEEITQKRILIKYANNLVHLDVLDPNTYQVEKIGLLPEDGVKGIVRDIHVNKQQELLVLTQSDSFFNIYKLNALNQFKLHVQISQSPQVRIIHTSFIQCFNGDFLLANDSEGLQWYDSKGNMLKHFEKTDFKSPVYPYSYPCKANFLHQAKDSSIWLSFSKIPGVFKIERSNQVIRQFSKLTNRKTFFRIWEDEANHLLIEQSNGVGRPPKSDQLYYIDEEENVSVFPFLLEERRVIADIYGKNFAKSIFVGHDTGLRILQNNQAKVKWYLAQNLSFNDRGITINSIDGDQNGNIYFAQRNGQFYHLDLSSEECQPLEITNTKNNRKLRISYPVDLYCEKDTQMLWGISSPYSSIGSLHKIDLVTCQGTTYPYQNKINSFLKSKKDSLFWLICETRNKQGKLVTFDPIKEKFTTFYDQEGNNPFEQALPRFILEARNEVLWIGTENGLFAFDRDSLAIRHITRSAHPKGTGLTSNAIYTIHEDKNGRLWLGTSNGLNIFDPISGHVETYDHSHGLASNTVWGILPEGDGNYWISTYNGLSYFEYEQKRFRNFYQLDGLSHDEFKPLAYYKDENERFYFGGVNGINAFFPNELLGSNNAPQVTITKFVKLNAKEEKPDVQVQNLDHLKQVSISPYDTYFQFHFIFPNYNRPLKNQFSVWLEGFDKDWVYLGNSPSVRYNKLPPGNYTLHIDGAGPNGNWSGKPRSIKIHVKPFFYNTWWFLLLMLLLSTGIVFGIFHYQLEQRIRVERIRMKLSSDLHDEMSGLLSGIAMQSDILQMMSNDQESQSRLKIIGEVSRKAMSKMSDVIWSIDSRKDRFEDLIQRMHEHADEILLPLDIQYHISCSKIDEQQKIPVTIRQNLYFIYKEAINNVAKHSSADHVQITFGNDGSQFNMVIKDNGKPQTPTSPKKGQGLENLKMRAKRLNAQLEILQNDGFTVTLTMDKFSKTPRNKGKVTTPKEHPMKMGF